ncbi:MAG: hypothetical protein K1X74_12220 [Pirellulales bacterium]|nr:hypothetical protein [Pirellulales bacterium]
MRVPLRRLYLDTARLGLMCQGAQRALNDFAKLLSEDGLSLYATRWLVHGDERAIANSRRQIPYWPGIDGLRVAVRDFIGAPAGSSVLFANRSRALAEVSIGLLASHCRRPLLVDLLWPPYQQSVIAACRSSASMPSIVRVRRRIFRDQMSADELIDVIAAHYRQHSCDGLFLPSVSHDGVRLPVARIHHLLRSHRPPELVVVDGAQGFAHTDSREDVDAADIYLVSAHKWLRSGLPLGIAICRDAAVTERLAHYEQRDHPSSEPLMRLVRELTQGKATSFGETVNVAPLVTCFGAVAELSGTDTTKGNETQSDNRERLADAVRRSGCELHDVAPELQCGILLLRARAARRSDGAPALPSLFDEQAIAVTCYPGGWIRLSAPRQARVSPENCTRLELALRTSSGTNGKHSHSISTPIDNGEERSLDNAALPQ